MCNVLQGLMGSGLGPQHSDDQRWEESQKKLICDWIIKGYELSMD